MRSDVKRRVPQRPATLAAAADYANCSTKTLRRRITDGSLAGYRFGKKAIRVDLDDVDRLFHQIPVGGSDAR